MERKDFTRGGLRLFLIALGMFALGILFTAHNDLFVERQQGVVYALGVLLLGWSAVEFFRSLRTKVLFSVTPEGVIDAKKGLVPWGNIVRVGTQRWQLVIETNTRPKKLRYRLATINGGTGPLFAALREHADV